MNEQIAQISARLKGLREALDFSVEEMAVKCQHDVNDIDLYESGDVDIPLGYLFDISQCFGIDTVTLLSGDEPRMDTYFLTRKGKGASVSRSEAYKYQALAAGFKNPKAEPFEVTVEPNNLAIYLNSHAGQEFNYVLEGRLQFRINNKDLILSEGDCIFFDSSKLHGMKALDAKAVKFLAIVLNN
ncbi:transcriptional regulator [Bacteroidales bacterium]|nr:transcriptional regulator [Bacteroidales bacterium]